MAKSECWNVAPTMAAHAIRPAAGSKNQAQVATMAAKHKVEYPRDRFIKLLLETPQTTEFSHPHALGSPKFRSPNQPPLTASSRTELLDLSLPAND
jgi:hypothetical protein